jgi:hypothetical protein
MAKKNGNGEKKLKDLTSEELQQVATEKLAEHLGQDKIELAVELAKCEEPESKIAENFRIDRTTIYRYKQNPIFSEYLSRVSKLYYDQAIKHGFGNKDNRIQALYQLANRTFKKLSVIDADQEAIGDNKSGKIIKRLSAEAYQKIAKELRETFTDIANELGQLEAKMHLSGSLAYQSNIDRNGNPEPPKKNGEEKK